MVPLTSRIGEKEFIVLMAMLMSVVAFSIDAMVPAMAAIGQELGATHANQTHHILNLFFVGLAVGELLSGMASDILGRKTVLYIGLTLYLIGTALCFTSETMTGMLIGRACQGVGSGAPYILVMSVVRDMYQGWAMARIMSLVSGVFIMVPIVAPMVGQLILEIGVWRDIFLAYIIYAALAMIWSKFRLPETLPKEKRASFVKGHMWEPLREAVRCTTLWRYTLALGCVFGALTGELNAAQQIFQGIYGLGDSFAYIFGAQALACGASSMVNGRLVKRFGMRFMTLIGAATMVGSSAAFLLYLTLYNAPFFLFMIYCVMLMTSVGFLFGNLNALALQPMGKSAGGASAILGSCGTLCGVGFGSIIGQMYNGTLFPIVIGFCVMGSVTFILVATGKSLHNDDTEAA